MIFLMVCSLFLTFAAFHHTEINRLSGWHGFPYRLFILPLPTFVLVALPMAFGLAAVETVYFSWSIFVFSPLHHPLVVWPGILCGAGFCWCIALVWCLAGFRVVRLAALAVSALVFTSIGLCRYMPDSLIPSVRFVNHHIPGIVEISVVAALFASWHFVESQRRGGGRGRGLLRRLLSVLPWRRNRRTDFKSPAGAQYWFEWHRSGWALPLSVVIALATVFLPISLTTRYEADATLYVFCWCMALPVILGTVAGLALSQPDALRADTMRLPDFMSIRPISTEDLVVTKLKVAAVSIAVTWLLVLTYICVWLRGWANTAQVWDLWNALVAMRGVWPARVGAALILITFVCLTFRGLAGDLWAGLSGSRWMCISSSCLRLAGLALLVWLMIAWAQNFQSGNLELYFNIAFWGLLAAVVLKLWVAALAWRHNSTAHSLHYAMLWFFATACMVAAAIIFCPRVFWLRELFILAALYVMPLARLGLTPLCLSRNRHR
jgi:hypothetical protein